MKVGLVMKIQKRHVISAALVLALSAAVYVNWQFGNAQKTPKQLGEASYVSADVSTATADSVQTAALSKEQESFFAAERVKRQSMQDKVMDEANKLLADNADEGDKTEAQKSVEQMLKNFTVQSSIESIVKAKGFSDCLCIISDEGVTVIVPKDQLNDTAALVIDDAVTSHYSVDYDKISIVGS